MDGGGHAKEHGLCEPMRVGLLAQILFGLLFFYWHSEITNNRPLFLQQQRRMRLCHLLLLSLSMLVSVLYDKPSPLV